MAFTGRLPDTHLHIKTECPRSQGTSHHPLGDQYQVRANQPFHHYHRTPMSLKEFSLAAVAPPSHPVAADVGLSPLGWLTTLGRQSSAFKAAEGIVKEARNEFLQQITSQLHHNRSKFGVSPIHQFWVSGISHIPGHCPLLPHPSRLLEPQAFRTLLSSCITSSSFLPLSILGQDSTGEDERLTTEPDSFL